MKIVRKSRTQAYQSTDLLSEEHADAQAKQPVQQWKNKSRPSASSELKAADFANMTHLEMRNWVNGEIRSGHMSLEDSTPFVWLNMNGVFGGEFEGTNDEYERIDFLEKARLRKREALEQGNEATANTFQSAIEIMLTHQGQTIGIDTCI